MGLNFVPLYEMTIKIGLLIDAGFAPYSDMTSELGFLVVLMDDKLNAKILYYGRTRSKRVMRSVLADGLDAMVLGFDICLTICLSINDIIAKLVPRYIYTDSRSL